MKFDSLRSVFQKKTSMQTCRTIKSLWAGGGWVGTTSWGQQWRGQLCGRWEPKRAGKLRDKPAGSWVWPFPPSTKQAQTPSLLHYAIGFKEIFELCMHFYIVILHHLSQLDLLVTLNAASRKHLLKSWDPVMLCYILYLSEKTLLFHAWIFFYYWCILVLSQQSFHAELWIHALFILNSTAEMQHFVQWLQYADS